MSTDARHAERAAEKKRQSAHRAPPCRLSPKGSATRVRRRRTACGRRLSSRRASLSEVRTTLHPATPAITAMSSAPMSVRAQTKEALFDTASIRPPDVDLESPVDVPLWRRPLVAGVTVAAIALVGVGR